MNARALATTMRWFGGMVLGAAILTLPALAKSDSDKEKKGKPSGGDPVTQGIMMSIFEPMAAVLPLSFDMKEFEATKNRKFITAKLKMLVDNSKVLDQHAKGKARAFEFVAKSLQLDAKHLYRWYTKERFDEARFTLHNMTENCITCHSSLPETHKVPPAKAFYASLKTDNMEPIERAHFYVMTRQFDEAIQTYQNYFASLDVPASSLVILGSFTDYMRVSVSVKGDFKTPRKTIESVLAKKDAPKHVKDLLLRWDQSLKDFEAANILAKTDLDTARKILKEGRDMQEFPRDRDGLVQFLVANAMLSRYVFSHDDRGVDVAEAYYMLGITESLLAHSFWISRAEFYFESAIRLAPGAPFAPKAYALLEESYVTNFSGSSGTHVPQDVRDLLAELRRIIEEAQGKRS